MENIAQKIRRGKFNPKDRGLDKDSHFQVMFHDGSERHEDDTNWSDMSEEKVVSFMGREKRVMISKHIIKRLRIKHGSLETVVEPKDDEQVYQSMRAMATFNPDGTTTHRNIGRVVGIVKNGKVIEERFLDGRTGEISGIKI